MQPDNPQLETTPDAATEEDLDLEKVDESTAPGEDELLFEWSVTDTDSHHRPTLWYVIIGTIFAATILIAIWLKTWIYLPLGILVPLALSMYVSKGIGNHQYRLTSYTVVADAKNYAYADYSSFFMVQNRSFITFELVPVKRFGGLLSIHASPEDAEDVAEILSSVLPETEPKGYVGESFFKRLRF